MMKRWTRIAAFILALVMAVGMLPVAPIFATDFIVPITTKEELIAMMAYPTGSYRLEANIDLGEIYPLGFDPQTKQVTAFSGILDGNGHMISFSTKQSPDLSSYGLFAQLTSAQIFNLNVKGDIRLEFDADGDYTVGMLSGKSDGTSVGGGMISGKLDVSGTDGSATVCGVLCYNTKTNSLTNVTTDIDTTVQANGDMIAYYYALTDYYRATECYVMGSASLNGDISQVRLLLDAARCKLYQNLRQRYPCDLRGHG